MKRHVAAFVVVLTSLLVIDSHVDWVQQDGRQLLEINGQRWDLRGWASEQLRHARRDCAPVSSWPADSPTARAVLPVIQQHSPPDSLSARWLQLLHAGDWSVAEVDFDTLQPAPSGRAVARARPSGLERLHRPLAQQRLRAPLPAPANTRFATGLARLHLG